MPGQVLMKSIIFIYPPAWNVRACSTTLRHSEDSASMRTEIKPLSQLMLASMTLKQGSTWWRSIHKVQTLQHGLEAVLLGGIVHCPRYCAKGQAR